MTLVIKYPNTMKNKEKSKTEKFSFIGKLCQNIILQLGKKEFIDDVLKLRKKWQIAVITRNDGENYPLIREDNSTELSSDEFILFFSNENLPVIKNKTLNEELSKKLKILFPKQENSNSPLSILLKNNLSEFNNDITKLRILYGLSEAHQRYLKSFVVYNYILIQSHFILSPVALTCSDNQNKEILLNLKIYPETTIKDIQDCWPSIQQTRKAILGRNPEKQSRKKNLERDLHICLLKNSGLKCKKIAETYINNEDSWQSISYQDVSKIIERLKKKK